MFDSNECNESTEPSFTHVQAQINTKLRQKALNYSYKAACTSRHTSKKPTVPLLCHGFSDVSKLST